MDELVGGKYPGIPLIQRDDFESFDSRYFITWTLRASITLQKQTNTWEGFVFR